MHPYPAGQHVEPQEHQPDQLDCLQAENEQLREQMAELSRQVAELTAAKAVGDTVLRTQGRIAKWLARLGIKVSVGVGLYDSIYALIRAWRSEDRIPDRELANALAAVTRRWLRVSLVSMVGGIVAVASIALLLWQNFLIQEQVAQQAQISNTNRRAELIATLYERRECEAENINDCPPRFSVRARAEAAIAFVELERVTRPESGPDLAAVDLSHGNLYAADFAYVTLRGANLQGADLGGANLQETALELANLQDAVLREANLQGASLELANLQDAVLRETDLQGADLGRANLQGASLELANLQDAVLRETDLQGADLGRANLQGADLGWANLQNTDLGRANLQGTDLGWADLQGADLWSAKLQRADLGSAKLQGAYLRGANLKDASLEEAILQGANLQGANLQGANLQGANLTDADLQGTFYSSETLWPSDYTPPAEAIKRDESE